LFVGSVVGQGAVWCFFSWCGFLVVVRKGRCQGGGAEVVGGLGGVGGGGVRGGGGGGVGGGWGMGSARVMWAGCGMGRVRWV